MVFSSLTFLLLFLPTLLFFYFIVKSDRWRNGVLLCASLLFYGWGEPVWILAMIFSTAVNYYCAILLDRTDSPGARKGFLTLGAAISLVMMVIVVVCMIVMNRFGEGEEQAVIL